MTFYFSPLVDVVTFHTLNKKPLWSFRSLWTSNNQNIRTSNLDSNNIWRKLVSKIGSYLFCCEIIILRFKLFVEESCFARSILGDTSKRIIAQMFECEILLDIGGRVDEQYLVLDFELKKYSISWIVVIFESCPCTNISTIHDIKYRCCLNHLWILTDIVLEKILGI